MSKKETQERYIVHADMDAFFTSVEQRDDPSLKGKSVIVGADPKGGTGRGVVAACSYEARKYGIHSAMPVSRAYRTCPGAIFIKPDMKKYSMVSKEIFKIFEEFTPDIEPLSIDEAFLDITGSRGLFGAPETICRNIKTKVKERSGLTVSIGMACNKTIAKIASDMDKPDGLTIVPREKSLVFLHPLGIKKLWGIGGKTAEEMFRHNIRTIGDLANFPEKDIFRIFGMSGVKARQLANGIDPRRVVPSEDILSVSNEHTFGEDTADENTLRDTLMLLSEKVSTRLRRKGLRGHTVTLKIRFSDFKTCSKSSSSGLATNLAEDIYHRALSSLPYLVRVRYPIRLIGIKVSRLEESENISDLFEGAHRSEKSSSIQEALDKIIDKYGEGTIRRRR